MIVMPMFITDETEKTQHVHISELLNDTFKIHVPKNE